MGTEAMFPGYITRQSLIDFCRKKGKEYGAEAEKLYDASETSGLDAETKATLTDGYAQALGRQRALREVTVWAADHSAPDIGQGAQLYGAGHA